MHLVEAGCEQELKSGLIVPLCSNDRTITEYDMGTGTTGAFDWNPAIGFCDP
jgi:hypothetical protein